MSELPLVDTNSVPTTSNLLLEIENPINSTRQSADDSDASDGTASIDIEHEHAIVKKCETESVDPYEMAKTYYHVGKEYGLKLSGSKPSDHMLVRKLKNNKSKLSQKRQECVVLNEQVSVLKSEIVERDNLLRDANNANTLLTLKIEELESKVSTDNVKLTESQQSIVDNKNAFTKIFDLVGQIWEVRNDLNSNKIGLQETIIGNTLMTTTIEQTVGSENCINESTTKDGFNSSLVVINDPENDGDVECLDITKTVIEAADDLINDLYSEPGSSTVVVANKSLGKNLHQDQPSKRRKLLSRQDLRKKLLFRITREFAIHANIMNSKKSYNPSLVDVDIPHAISNITLEIAIEGVSNNTSEKSRKLFYEYQRESYLGVSKDPDTKVIFVHFAFYKRASFFCPCCSLALNTSDEFRRDHIQTHANLNHFPPEYADRRLILHIL